MKVLVLGGTRFIGLRLVRYLSSLGHDITILNRGKTQAQLPTGIKRLYADRRDPEALRSALNGQEFEVIFDITGYELSNVKPVIDLFAGKIAHYVFLSTGEVYDKSRYVPILEDFPRKSPITKEKGFAAYGANKVECEDFLLQKCREAKLPVSIIRCTYIYGPENWMHDREFSFFARLAQGRKVLVPGRGTNILHFAYVDDVTKALLAVAGKKNTQGQAFNVASAEAITIEGYIDTIAEIMGVKAPKVYLDSRVMGSLKAAVFPFEWDENTFLGIHKAKEYFGFWPAHNMKEGLTNAYEWWKKNLDIAGTRFEPGRLGHDVDLAYEDELLKQHQ